MNSKPARTTIVGTAASTQKALCVLIDGWETGDTTHDPAEAATMVTLLRQQLGFPITAPSEPPCDWDQLTESQTLTGVLQHLTDRIDDAAYGYADWDAAKVLLDRVCWMASVATTTNTTSEDNKAF